MRCHTGSLRRRGGPASVRVLLTLTLALALTAVHPAPSGIPRRSVPPPPRRHDALLGLLWFGANVSGLDSAEQLEFIHRHELAGFGWQQSTHRTGRRHAETALAQAVSRLAATQGASSAPAPAQQVRRRFVYRHMLSNWVMFDVMRAAATRVPASGGIFMRDNDNSPNASLCATPPHGGATGPSTMPLVFEDTPDTAHYYLNEVVAELVTESDLSAVFFDETDWSACGYDFGSVGCHNISDRFRVDDLLAKLPTIR
jgi:hypothetical protein